MKYFDVSTVGVVCSLTPLMVCLIAYFVLGERMKKSELLSIFFVVAAVALVMIGSSKPPSSPTQEEEKKDEVGVWPLIALIS